jgi:uncharacterized membrane protein
MRISLGFLNVAHLTTQYMDVTSLLAWDLFYVSWLCMQSLFVHTGCVVVVIVVRIVPAMQFVLHGDITLPLYKWRLDKCLHFIKFK